MWEWTFSITPAHGNGGAFKSTLYNSSETISYFLLWNEAEYGSTAADQHAWWTPPTYQTADKPGVEQKTMKSYKF